MCGHLPVKLYTSRLHILATGCLLCRHPPYRRSTAIFIPQRNLRLWALTCCAGLQRSNFMSHRTSAQVKALSVFEDAFLSHDFSCPKNFSSNRNSWNYLLVHLTSILFLGDVGTLRSFLSGSLGYLVALIFQCHIVPYNIFSYLDTHLLL